MRNMLMGLWVVLAVLAGGCSNRVATLRTAGVREYQAGNRYQARAYFRNVLDQKPADPTALHYMGRIYHEEKDYRKAVFFYESCLEADPGYPTTREWLAKARSEAADAGVILEPAETPYVTP